MWTYIRDKVSAAGSGLQAGTPPAEGFPHFTKSENHVHTSVMDGVFGCNRHGWYRLLHEHESPQVVRWMVSWQWQYKHVHLWRCCYTFFFFLTIDWCLYISPCNSKTEICKLLHFLNLCAVRYFNVIEWFPVSKMRKMAMIISQSWCL